ncbi:hypothetical protein HZS_1581 [Henneguya salminicola]|nr:hypothetical protein HZS_1581 [Henneguya salminicola]
MPFKQDGDTSTQNNFVHDQSHEGYNKNLTVNIDFQHHNNIKLYSSILNAIHMENKYKDKSPQLKTRKANYSPINKIHLLHNQKICKKHIKNDNDLYIYKSFFNEYIILFNLSFGHTTIYYKNCDCQPNVAKFTIDNKILVAGIDCLKLYKNNIAKASYKTVEKEIYHIDCSNNGELILASRKLLSLYTQIWSYDQISSSSVIFSYICICITKALKLILK